MAITSAWIRSAKCTIPIANVPGDQTDFPIMLIWNGTSGNIPVEVYNSGPVSPTPTGSDIRFSSDAAGNTELAFEIVSFVPNSTVANARVKIWIKMPSVSSATPTTFYMWWGNPHAVAYAATDTYGRNNVWSSSFIGVWHLSESSGATATNSLGSNNGTYTGTTFPNRVDTTYGYMQNFVNANGNYVALTGTSPWQITGNISISALFTVSFFSVAWQTLIAKGDFTYRLSRNNTNSYMSFDRNAGVPTGVNTTVVTSGYHHIVGTFNTTSGTRCYIDGSSGTLNTDTTATTSNTDVLCIGRNTAYATRDWNGYVGEVKIATVARSSTWVTTEYNTTIGYSSFVSYDLPTGPISDITTNLAVWWKFDEATSGAIGSNAVKDFSGNANAATGYGGATWGIGRLGRGSLSLVSSLSQYASTANALVNTPTIQGAQTFTAWVYCTAIGSAMDIVTESNYSQGNQLRITPAGYLEVSKWGGGVSCTATTLPLTATTWYFVAWTYDGAGNSALYVNGVRCAITSMSATQTGTPTVITAGAYGGTVSSGEYFNGRIDDVRIYTRALTINDILQLYSYRGESSSFFALQLI